MTTIDWSEHKPGFHHPGGFLISSAELRRVLRLRSAERISTCFTVIRESRQYLVTAAHCVEALNGLGGEIEIHLANGWTRVEARVIGLGTDGVDVAVLACGCLFPFTPVPALETVEGLCLGQEIRFAGFPLGLEGPASEAFQLHPMPFIKHGIVSCIWDGSSQPIILDGQNTRGFSDVPLYYWKDNGLTLGAVISGYRHTSSKVLTNEGEHTGLHVHVNSGVMHAYSIHHAINIIREHGGGFLL